jgi:RimJ/RimL family protein N-acetyltransferase
VDKAGADETRVGLRDGSTVVARPIRPNDREAFLATFERLGEESRYLRFLTPVPRLSETQVDYLVEVDHHNHEALIAFELETGKGVGIARFVRDPEEPEMAEAAVAVADEWQGRGIGKALCRLLADRAREEGIARFDATLLARNRGMLAVLDSIGPTRVVSSESGTIAVEVSLPEQGIGEHMTGVLRAVATGGFELATPPGGSDLLGDD